MPRQPAHAVDSVLFVQVGEDLGVARAAEAMPLRDQLGAQLDVVVDLAVQRRPDGAVLVGDRLVAGLEVDDAQPARADPHARLDVEAVGVGAAVCERVGHRVDGGRVDRFVHRVMQDAGYAAHVGESSMSR